MKWDDLGIKNYVFYNFCFKIAPNQMLLCTAFETTK